MNDQIKFTSIGFLFLRFCFILFILFMLTSCNELIDIPKSDVPSVDTDQRHFLRPVNSNSDRVAKIDVGTLEAEHVEFPIVTLVPSDLTPTANIQPYITLDQNANCRFGPSTAKDIIGIAQSGQKYEITGRDTSSDWFRIRLGDSTNCWIAGITGHITGDVSNIEAFPDQKPLITITATPNLRCNIYGPKNCPGGCWLWTDPYGVKICRYK